jgi:uncharacterized membrane-anchored protein YjiN (DUF445 family)
MSSTAGLPYPPVPRFSLADEMQARRALRRNRLLATGLLIVMMVIAAATRLEPTPGWLVQLVRAGAEAGIVGGLADWFAITVLFRHPLGIPIPHTAILPRSKDRIGRSLGSFVERNFLIPEVILPKVRQLDLTNKVAAWLELPQTAPVVADWVITITKRLLAASDSAQITQLIQHTLGQQLRAVDLAPILGRAIKILMTSDESDVILEKIVEAAENWITANKAKINEMVHQRSGWWIPRMIDRRIATAIVEGALDVLHQLRQSDSEMRIHLREAISKMSNDFITSNEQRNKLQRMKDLILDDAEVRAWVASSWDGISQGLINGLSDPGSTTRSTLQSAVLAVARSLREDTFMRTRIDATIEYLVTELVQWRGEIGSMISDVVRNWDARTVSDRLEMLLGSDLQYIRINGTIVGGLVGCAIYLLSMVVQFGLSS